MPFSKARGAPTTSAAWLRPCATNTYETRVRLMLAQQALGEECGMGELTPKVWGGGVTVVVG